MLSSRSNFACSIITGKVFVADGCSPSSSRGISLAEVYDPLTDRWKELPPMPEPQANCVGLSFKGSFHVLSSLFETGIFHVFIPKQSHGAPLSRSGPGPSPDLRFRSYRTVGCTLS